MRVKRYFWQVFETTDEGGAGGAESGGSAGGEAAQTGDVGSADGAAGGEGQPGNNTGAADGHWLDSVTDEHREQLSGMSSEDAMKRLTASVPEKYATPEGVNIDPESTAAKSIENFNEMAKEAGLSQAQYDAVVAFDVSRSRDFGEAARGYAAEVNKVGMAEMQKTLGSDKFNTTVESARKVMGAVKDEGLKSFLEKTDLGNNPQMIDFFARFGAILSEDGLNSLGGIGGMPKSKGDPAQGDGDMAKRAYPNMK